MRPQPGKQGVKLRNHAGRVGRVGYGGALRAYNLGSVHRVASLNVKRARVAVVPSLYENFPLAVVEAMSLGTPIVVSDLPTLKEIVRTDDEGLTFAAGAPAELAARVTELLTRADRWERVRRGAAERAKAFRTDTVVDQLLAAWGVPNVN